MDYDDEKVLALAKHLNIDPALISNDYGDYYTVNGRTVKEGKTPEQFKQLAADFRSLLSEEMQELVTDTILNPTREVEVENIVVKDDKSEITKVKKPLREVTYSRVKEYLEPIAEKAKKRAEVLARLDARPQPPRIEDTYNKLKQDNLYVENILYTLTKEDDKYSRNTNYTDSLRRAWLGQPISDTREDRVIDDGEYRVMDDDEADEAEREYLEQLFDDIVEVPSHLEGYVDKDRWIDDQAGNRGENLNGYDGTEDSVEFEGTTYYIYRNN